MPSLRDAIRRDVFYATQLMSIGSADVTVAVIAADLDLHPNSVRAALKFLMDMRLVSSGKSRGEPAEYWVTYWGQEVIDMFESPERPRND